MDLDYIAPKTLDVNELRNPRPVVGGTTSPRLVAGREQGGRQALYVLKLRNPGTPMGQGHHGPTSLACELICAMLCRYLDLPVPDYAIATVSDGFANSIFQPDVRNLFRNNLGLNFATTYEHGVALWNPDSRPRSEKLLFALENTLSFDATVINGDRKAAKPNLLRRGEALFLIDHSLALPMHLWSDDEVRKSPLLPKDEVLKHCTWKSLYEQGRPYERLRDTWRTSVDQELLDRIRTTVPHEWETRAGDFNRLFAFLEERRDRLDAITADLRRIVR